MLAYLFLFLMKDSLRFRYGVLLLTLNVLMIGTQLIFPEAPDWLGVAVFVQACVAIILMASFVWSLGGFHVAYYQIFGLKKDKTPS